MATVIWPNMVRIFWLMFIITSYTDEAEIILILNLANCFTDLARPYLGTASSNWWKIPDEKLSGRDAALNAVIKGYTKSTPIFLNYDKYRCQIFNWPSKSFVLISALQEFELIETLFAFIRSSLTPMDTNLEIISA